MGHHSAGRLVFDALMDYPANAILQRVGLLESMMNLLTAVDTHETGDTSNVFHHRCIFV